MECSNRAADAEVNDPGLEKGPSKLPEATFSVVTKFRAKDLNLHQKHYFSLTNLGLIQADMTLCFKKRGPNYHWIQDLYSILGLPLLDGIQEMVCFHFLYIYSGVSEHSPSCEVALQLRLPRKFFTRPVQKIPPPPPPTNKHIKYQT